MTAQPVRLADCITLTKGKPPAEIPYFGDDAEPYLSPEYLRGKGTAEPAKPAPNAVRVRDGDAILLWDGSNAGEFFRGRKGLLSSTMTHIGHSEEFEPEYFYYAAKRWEAYLKSQTSGSGIPHVDKEVFGKLEILQLAPGEQRLVAGILAKIDRAIVQTEAIFAKQQRIKSGLMQDLLTRGIDKHGNIRSETTHKFMESSLGRIPLEWDVKELGNRAFVTKLAGFEFTNHFDYREGGEIIALRALNIKKEQLDLSNVQRISRIVSDKLPRSKIFANNILITYIGAYIGEVLRIEENDKYHLAPNIAKIVATKFVTPQFLEIFLRTSFVQRQIKNLTAITATPSLTMTQIRKLLISIPESVDEQNEIVSRIRTLSNAVRLTEAELNKLISIKTGLMQDLLTGKVRVTELITQPVAH